MIWVAAAAGGVTTQIEGSIEETLTYLAGESDALDIQSELELPLENSPRVLFMYLEDRIGELREAALELRLV